MCPFPACNGDYHVIGQSLDHSVDAAVPARRRFSNLRCYCTYLVVDIGEHVGQVALDQPHQEFLYGI